MKLKGVVSILLFSFSISSGAGEHVSTKDDFTGEVNNAFNPTLEEAQASKAVYSIQSYNSSRNTVFFAISPTSGSTACNTQYLLLKDSNGEIHKIDAEERNLSICVAANLDADLVKKPFKVRIPMHRGKDLDVDVDTTDLDLSKLEP